MVKLTIIIPVYNLEAKIARCLDSVLNQTWRDMQVVLIDDGSTDQSASICRQYAEADDRVVYRYQENGGVSAARNHGIDLAAGEYLMFVDGDDYLLPDMVENYVRAAEATGVEVIAGGMEVHEASGEVYLNVPPRVKQTPAEFLNAVCSDQTGLFGYVHNKLVLRQLIQENGIRFPEGIKLQEDLDFALSAYEKADRFCCIDDHGYVYFHELNKHKVIMLDLIANQLKLYRIAENRGADTGPVLSRIQDMCYVTMYEAHSADEIRGIANLEGIHRCLNRLPGQRLEKQILIRWLRDGRYAGIYRYFQCRHGLRSVWKKFRPGGSIHRQEKMGEL